MSDRNAKEIRAEAADWISRRDGDGWNEAAQTELDAWLAQSHAHVVAFLRAEAAWGRADKLVALKPQSSRRVAETLKDAWPTALRAVAAAAVITVVGVAASTYLTTSNEKPTPRRSADAKPSPWSTVRRSRSTPTPPCAWI